MDAYGKVGVLARKKENESLQQVVHVHVKKPIEHFFSTAPIDFYIW